MMGGSGTRVGAEIPKQFIEIDGTPIFQYIVNISKLNDEEKEAVAHLIDTFTKDR